MPDLSTRFLANCFHVVIHEAEGESAPGSIGPSWWPIHSLKWFCCLLELTAASGNVAHTGSVSYECSPDNFATPQPAPSSVFHLARSNAFTGATAVPHFDAYQSDWTLHSDAVLTNVDLTGVLGAGTDNIGTGAGDFYPFGWFRANMEIAAGGPFSYRIHLFGQGQ